MEQGPYTTEVFWTFGDIMIYKVMFMENMDISVYEQLPAISANGLKQIIVATLMYLI